VTPGGETILHIVPLIQFNYLLYMELYTIQVVSKLLSSVFIQFCSMTVLKIIKNHKAALETTVMSSSSSVQFSSNSVSSFKSIILLNIECPQRNQISDRMEKPKAWEKAGSVGGPVLQHGVIMIQAASQVRLWIDIIQNISCSPLAWRLIMKIWWHMEYIWFKLSLVTIRIIYPESMDIDFL